MFNYDLDAAMREISELSFKFENYSLVRVSTFAIKQALYDRARQLRDYLAQIVADFRTVYSGWLPEDGATHSSLEGASFAQDVEKEARA